MKARDHELLFQRFSELARRARKVAKPTEAEVATWEDDKLIIEAEEPPTYRALEADCYNEVCRAWGRPSPHAPKLSLARKFLMQWWRFEGSEPLPQQPAHAA